MPLHRSGICRSFLLISLFALLITVFGPAVTARAALPTTAGTSSTSVAASTPAATAAAATSAAEAPAPDPTPTVLLGVSGLTFEDLDPHFTPHLYDLARTGAIATVTPRSVRTTSCPVDGWLAVNSGRRAADEVLPECREPASPLATEREGDGTVGPEGQGASGADLPVPDWDVYADRAEEDNYAPHLGLLAEGYPEIVAIGPGAAIATADAEGEVGDYAAPAGDAEDFGRQVAGALDRSDLVVVDLGNAEEYGYSLRALDARVGAVRGALTARHTAGSDAANLLVTSLSDGRTDDTRMQFAAATGPDFPRGILSANSTKQPGLVQTTDVLPTLLAAVDVLGTKVDANLAGAPIHTVEPGWGGVAGSATATGEDRIRFMLDRQVAVATQEAVSAWFFPVFAIGLLGLVVVALAVGRRAFGRVRNPLAVGGAFFAAVPVSTYLVNTVPWERSTSPDVAMLGGVAGWALVITLVALLGPWKRHPLGPLVVLTATTVGVLVVDILAGSPLQMSTLMGEPLLIAARFYGLGNSGLALYCTALLVGLGAVCTWIRTRWARIAVVAIAVLASCIVLATPGLGTKFGSVPTLLIGSAVLVFAVAGVRMTFGRVISAIGAAGGVMLLVLFADWLRPANHRTHFGRFFDSIVTGEAWPVLVRKIDMNIGILTQSWMTLLLPLVLAAVFWVLLDPARFRLPALPDLHRRFPFVRSALASLVVLLTVGTVINDSGVVVPAVGVLFLAPVHAHLVGHGAKTLPRCPAPADTDRGAAAAASR
ncbi:hypothetical protein [Brevibacterium litoralis]|uniref:hypothetical protein n=1 Tax=Brevibacterium litoralis TaxID=3138935 RepID=UPI0032EBA5D7